MRPRSNPFAACMTPEAEALLRRVENRHERSYLLGFLGHACSRGRPLHELDAADLAAFEAALVARAYGYPKQSARGAGNAWNRMTTQPGWPGGPIALKSNVPHPVPSFGKLPARLRQDISDFLARQSEDDVFGEGAKPLAAATLKDRRRKVCQLVGIAVACGADLSMIKSLKDLAREPVARQILQTLWERSGRKPNGHAANLARLLRLIAKHHVKATQDVLDLIGKAESRLRPGRQGMTDRNKKKLRQIVDNEETLRRLIQLPAEVMTSLDASKPTVTDAILVQSALGVQTALLAPMRAKNLAGLDFERHIDIIGNDRCHIVIEAQDVKNDQNLEYSLGPDFVRLLTLYRKVYWPILAGAKETSAVFISRAGRQKTPEAFGAQIAKFIKKRIGVSMHIHLFRHLAGYLFLKAHPGEYEPVRQLLGHKSLQTTIDFYVGLERAHSFRRYDDILKSYNSKVDAHVDG